MPVNLSVKNVPDDLAARLKERAKRNNRSLQGDLVSILVNAVEEKRLLTVDEVRERMRGLGLPEEPNSVDIIRHDRDSR